MAATLRSHKYSAFRAPKEIEGVNYYFREVEAHEWKLKHYLNYRLEKEEILPSWIMIYKDWQESIVNIKKNNYKNVPGSICSFCNELLNVDTFEGLSILKSCRDWYIKFYDRNHDLKLSERVQKQETTIFSTQNISELLQSTTVLGKRENASDLEEERILKRQHNRDGYTTPSPQLCEDDNLIIELPKFSGPSQQFIFDGGLPNYEDDINIDPELILEETNEATIPYFERSFNHDSWKSWTLKSGSVVTDLLEKASSVKGHPLRPEVWRIIRCGFKIAKPRWLNNEEYTEIQSFTKRPSITSPPKHIIELLKIKSLESLGFEVKRFKRDKLNEDTHLLNDIINQYSGERKDLFLENIKITCSMLYHEDPFTAFFIKVLSLFHKYVFIQDSIMQHPVVSEAVYGGYLVHPCLKKILVGLEDCLYYQMGEVILSSVKSCRSRRKSISPYEQKSDGVFSVKLTKSLIEIGHLEMSGGYGHKDIPRSTWDEDRIELWQMYNPSCGVLQYERSHKSIVPICYEDHRKHIFDFVVLLWDLKYGLLETSRIIFQLRDENNDNLFESSKLSGSLPAYPFTPSKDKYKIGIKDTNVDSDPDNSSPIRYDKKLYHIQNNNDIFEY
ncbi:15768_t:CDS:2 [Funneliformis mosseae]|uniref:15768_t:CDS:1 n=1 Tax=Funneliformis mosseae TaxID=27381 RepID=A0A9N9GFW4_FUNMO|nr:15768_t:CDS:2 [Funneliformis mosseae]